MYNFMWLVQNNSFLTSPSLGFCLCVDISLQDPGRRVRRKDRNQHFSSVQPVVTAQYWTEVKWNMTDSNSYQNRTLPARISSGPEPSLREISIPRSKKSLPVDRKTLSSSNSRQHENWANHDVSSQKNFFCFKGNRKIVYYEPNISDYDPQTRIQVTPKEAFHLKSLTEYKGFTSWWVQS
jgi:hypothetical protein